MTADTLEGTLRQRILAVLRESQLPVPTSDLAALCAGGLSHPRQRVWAELRVLERCGVAARRTVQTPRSSRTGKGRGACVVCKRPCAFFARFACRACWENPDLRPDGPAAVRAVTTWRLK